MRLIIEVPDDQAPAIQAQMEQWGYPVQVEEDVPTWHKEGIDSIRANTPREAYILLDDFLKEWE